MKTMSWFLVRDRGANKNGSEDYWDTWVPHTSTPIKEVEVEIPDALYVFLETLLAADEFTREGELRGMIRELFLQKWKLIHQVTHKRPEGLGLYKWHRVLNGSTPFCYLVTLEHGGIGQSPDNQDFTYPFGEPIRIEMEHYAAVALDAFVKNDETIASMFALASILLTAGDKHCT